MNLKEFIQKLQHIADDNDAEGIPVQMADTLLVVEPAYENGVVYITDRHVGVDDEK